GQSFPGLTKDPAPREPTISRDSRKEKDEPSSYSDAARTGWRSGSGGSGEVGDTSKDEGELMKRKLAVWTLLAALSGWASPAALAGKFMSQAVNNAPEGARWGPSYAPEATGYVGPYGRPIHQMAPASSREPTGADYVHA